MKIAIALAFADADDFNLKQKNRRRGRTGGPGLRRGTDIQNSITYTSRRAYAKAATIASRGKGARE